MSLHLKRPKRINEEDEDDLLKFQEEFLKNKAQIGEPAAKVIRNPITADGNQSEQSNNINKEKKSEKTKFDSIFLIFYSEILNKKNHKY